jgi:hypothetical protein
MNKKLAAAFLATLVPATAFAVVQNPVPGWVWTYYGPTLGADWGPSDIINGRVSADNLPTPGNFYVGGVGASDGNDCLASTITVNGHGPCATLQFVVNRALRKYYAQSFNHTINVAAGTYNSGFVCSGPITGGGSGNVTYNGSLLSIVGANSATTFIADTTSGQPGAIVVSMGCAVQLSHLTLSTTQSGASDVFVQNFGYVGNSVDVVYGAAPASYVHAEAHGMWEAFANFTLTGNTPAAFAVSTGGYVEIDPSGLTVTLTGTPAYSIGFINAVNNGIVYTGNATFSGAAVGSRALITSGGTISTNGNANPNYLPGTNDRTGKIINRGGRYTPEPVTTIPAGATGLGTGGTVTLNAGSNSSNGTVLLNAGTGAAALGQAFVTLPIYVQSGGGNYGICTANISALGTGLWNAGSVTPANLDGVNTDQLNILWNNNGVALTNGAQYAINYHCGGVD